MVTTSELIIGNVLLVVVFMPTPNLRNILIVKNVKANIELELRLYSVPK